MYGESPADDGPDALISGLSPRVRGILAVCHGALEVKGSIPACTGNPGIEQLAKLFWRVYPRVYGESSPGAVSGAAARGLSPRVRGIPEP